MASWANGPSAVVKQKNLALEGLRGIACLAVVIGHFAFVFFPYLGTIFVPIPGVRPAFAFERWVSYPPFTLLFSAEAAVCVFFVMSGYVLTAKFYATGSVGELQSAAAKRYVRLVLPTFASIMLAWGLWKCGAILTRQGLAIGVAGWVPAWYQKPYSFIGALWNGLAGAPLFADTTLNPPAWTIQVELIGSILIFAMITLFGRRPILFVGWSLFFSNLLGFQLPNVLFYVAFFSGALLNLARDWLRSHQIASLVLVGVGLVGVAYNMTPTYEFIRAIPLPNLQPIGPDFRPMPRLFWNSFGSIALVAGVIGSHQVESLLGVRPLAFLGKISFSMYLVHMPILMSLALGSVKWGRAAGMSYGAAAGITFVLYLTVVIALSILFFRGVDAPSMRLANYLGAKGPRWGPGCGQQLLKHAVADDDAKRQDVFHSV